MRSNLIPKSFSRQKLTIFKNFTFLDLLLLICYLAITIAIVSGLAFLSNFIKLIVGIIIFSLLSILVINNKNYNLKNYQVVIIGLRFFIQKKQYFNNNQTINTSLLVPFNRIVQNLIETKKLDAGSHWYIGALEIKGFNISTLSIEEQNIKISELQNVFKSLDCQISLIKIDQPVETIDQIRWLKKKKNDIKKLFIENKISLNGYKSRVTQIDGYIKNDFKYNNSGLNVAIAKNFYLFIYHKNIQDVKKFLVLAENKIIDFGLKAIICDKYKLVNTIKSIFAPFDLPFSNKLINSYSENLSELLKFIDIKFYKDYLKINEMYYSINAIYDYPIFPKNGWGAQISNTFSSVIWNINNTEIEEIKDLLNKAVGNAATNILSVKKVVDKSEQYYQMNAFDELIETLGTGEEMVKKCNILFLNYGTDLKSLKANESHLKQVLKDNSIKLDKLKFRQKEGLSAILPKPTDPLIKDFGREIPTWTLASSFPFINCDLKDKEGLLMGYNMTGDIVMFNQFRQDYHRKNFNQLLLGTSGSGKSHTGKKQLNWHICNGRKVIIIDPEREYKKLCNYHDGTWIDVGNGQEGNINPLQILSSLDDAKNNKAIISNYLQTLEHWFSIILPDLSINELRYLIQKINELYKNFNLTEEKNINNFSADKFPIFSDLLTLLKSQSSKNDIHKKITNIIELEFTGSGKYAQLYNFHSSLELNKNLLSVFDINSLFEKGNNNVIQAQLFLILAYIQNEVKINSYYEKNEIVILVDEAHLIIDKDNPVGLNFMFQMVKRIRKRKGGIILITQNPDDFIGNADIRKKTTAMMNNTQYTMVLNLSPQNLTDVAELFKAYGGLSYQEKNFIARAKRGQALFVVSGFNRHCLQVVLSETELLAFENKN